MTLALPLKKIKKIKMECRHWLHTTGTSPRQLACLIGFMTLTSPAVLLSPLHYRMLQILYSQSLSRSQQDYDSYISLDTGSLSESSMVDSPDAKLKTSANFAKASRKIFIVGCFKTGLGAYCGNTQEKTGVWTLQEQQAHINMLELQAAFLIIQTFLKTKRDLHVLS